MLRPDLADGESLTNPWDVSVWPRKLLLVVRLVNYDFDVLHGISGLLNAHPLELRDHSYIIPTHKCLSQIDLPHRRGQGSEVLAPKGLLWDSHEG